MLSPIGALRTMLFCTTSSLKAHALGRFARLDAFLFEIRFAIR